MTKMTLEALWNKYYNPDILKRLDLRKEWEFVKNNKKMNVSELFRIWNEKLDLSSSSIETKIQKLLKIISNLSEDEQSLAFFNLLPIVKYYIKEGDQGILDSLIITLEQILKEKKDRPLPSKVIIELTNNCNLNCIMCGVGSAKYSETKNMPLEVFSRIMNSLPDSVKMVRLNGLGESTIIPNFTEYLNILENYNYDYELVTNLSTQNENIIARLLDLEFDLYVSCDSPNMEKLQKIRRNLDTKTFLRNLSIIRDCVNRNRIKNHFIFTIMQNNFTDLPNMVEFANRYNIGGIIGNMVKGFDEQWKRTHVHELVNVFGKTAKLAEKYNIIVKLPNDIEGCLLRETYCTKTNSKRCQTFEEEIFIRYNGDVCPCNMMNPFIYGNLGGSNIAEIINGNIAEIFYKLINTKYKHPYCLNCYFMP